MASPIVIVRYGEIALKLGNRAEFERKLQRAVKVCLRDFEHGPVVRERGRIVVRELPEAWMHAERVSRVFGVKSTSPGVSTERNLAAIVDAAAWECERALTRRGSGTGEGLTMRVETTRADKSFPHRSMEVTLAVAGRLKERFPALGVRMKHPDITVDIDIRSREILISAERFEGPAGLPIGSQGKALGLLSGGIDSPVAIWLAMKRGLLVECLYFHAAPFIGEATKQKVVELAAALSRFSHSMRLYVIPFADVQVAIKKGAPEGYRTLLYRRSMNRIASRLATELEASALVTGESLGQVASQTIENIRAIEDAAAHLIVRPLVTFDKEETMTIARRIGTFDISARPHPDCCSLFQPARPKIHGSPSECQEIEASLALTDLETAALSARELIVTSDGRRMEIKPRQRTEPGATN